jgi:hypothetical protein
VLADGAVLVFAQYASELRAAEERAPPNDLGVVFVPGPSRDQNDRGRLASTRGGALVASDRSHLSGESAGARVLLTLRNGVVGKRRRVSS